MQVTLVRRASACGAATVDPEFLEVPLTGSHFGNFGGPEAVFFRFPPGDATQWRHRERDGQERDGPRSCLVGDVVAGVCSQCVQVALNERGVKTFDQRRGGDERRGEAQDFDDRDRLQ